MRTILTDAAGKLPPNPRDANKSDPPIGVLPDGSLKVSSSVGGGGGTSNVQIVGIDAGIAFPTSLDAVAAGVAFPTIAAPFGSSTVVEWGDTERTATGAAIHMTQLAAYYRQVILTAKSTNGAPITFGPNSACRLSLLPGQSYYIPPVEGAVFDLYAWYLNGTAGDKVIISWVK